MRSPGTNQQRLFQQVKASLLAVIAQGRFAVGAVLPGVDRLAKQHRCSVGTVRRALGELASEGIVRGVQGRGTIVCRQPQAGRVCLILSSDMHTNLLLQHAIYAALVRANYHVDVIPVTSLATADVVHACRRCADLRRSAQPSDCVVAIDPHFQDMAADDWQRFRQAVFGFARRVYFSLDQHPRIGDTALVTIDHEQSAREVLRHLFQLGHRTIAVATGGDDSWLSDTAEYCRQFADVVGGAIVPHVLADPLQTATELFARGTTAYWAVTDHFATLIARQCREAAITIPGDVSLVGRFNTPWSLESEPPLTTVALDPEGIAAALVDSLGRQAESRSAEVIATAAVTRVPVKLICRGSTAAVRPLLADPAAGPGTAFPGSPSSSSAVTEHGPGEGLDAR